MQLNESQIQFATAFIESVFIPLIKKQETEKKNEEKLHQALDEFVKVMQVLNA